MSNVDYSRYARINNGADKETVEDIVETPDDTVVEEIPDSAVEEPIVEPEPEVVEEDVETPDEPEIIPVHKFGRVYNCEKLNVRQEPKGTAPIVCELFRNAEVEIHEFGSTDDFYMVYTASGITGFCMKKYILEK